MDSSLKDLSDRNIWPSCGYSLLAVDGSGRLLLSDAFLRRFLQRPELVLVEESCAHERALHQALLDDPRRLVDDAQLQALSDPDARENYRYALAFRDLLQRHHTLEEAYLALVSGRDAVALPASLFESLVQLLVRHVLAQQPSDAYQWRAAELLFRRQRVSVESGVVVADADYLQRHRRPQALTVLQSLIREAGGVAADGMVHPNLGLLNKDTLGHYRANNEAHDLALSLDPAEPGLPALCRVLERWLFHFHGVTARITPLREIDDEHWRWHVGLDATANELLNRLYLGHALDPDQEHSLLALFRLDFDHTTVAQPELAGYPVYLAIAMTSEQELQLKPQNLLLNLPLAERA